MLPPLLAKALADNGYDLVAPGESGWFVAGISGSSAKLLVKAVEAGALLALSEPAMAERIGLLGTAFPVPANMASVGLARRAAQLHEALRVLHSLQTHPQAVLEARLEARLAAIPETERTREVRQRVGQDVFREALMDLWQGRCAVTGLSLPPALLRASHAKPWAISSDAERLDPFNGLLLSIHLDAMFDTGLIAFDDDGRMMLSPLLDTVSRLHFRISDGLQLQAMSPGHMPYLSWHRQFVYRPSCGP